MSGNPVRKAGLIALVSVVSLCACAPETEQASAQRFAAVSPPSGAPGVSAQRARPHSGNDPHANLSPEQHLEVALQHQAEGRPQEAMAVLDSAIVRYPDHAGLLAVRGSALLGQGRASAALADLEAAVELEPDNALILTNRAQAYRQFGRIAESLADLNVAIALAPDLVAARFNRGAIRYSSGEYEAALVDFNHCIGVAPYTAGPYFNRAAVYDALGQRNAAIADLKRFLELADNEAWKDTARVLLQQWEVAADTGNSDRS